MRLKKHIVRNFQCPIETQQTKEDVVNGKMVPVNLVCSAGKCEEKRKYSEEMTEDFQFSLTLIDKRRSQTYDHNVL